jgi:hypothetical protein
MFVSTMQGANEVEGIPDLKHENLCRVEEDKDSLPLFEWSPDLKSRPPHLLRSKGASGAWRKA